MLSPLVRSHSRLGFSIFEPPLSDHTADWDFSTGLFTILVYGFKAPNGLLTSPTLWPLVFGFETHDLIVRGVHSKYTIGWVSFPTRLF